MPGTLTPRASERVNLHRGIGERFVAAVPVLYLAGPLHAVRRPTPYAVTAAVGGGKDTMDRPPTVCTHFSVGYRSHEATTSQHFFT